ncbi:replication initiator [Streptosporangium sp. NPDC001681]|uniref:replication initiator n=1 Tax=Streptosporangium sp. NPDC001681 TaxID=3154395 RepID=UPI0033184BD8
MTVEVEAGRGLGVLRDARLLALDAAEQIAAVNGVCIRPLVHRRVDIATGQADMVHVPCGARLEAKCPPCAKRNRQVRRAQCREGWHLEAEPSTAGAGGPVTVAEPGEAGEGQRWLVEMRADLEAQREVAACMGADTAGLEAAIVAVEAEIGAAEVRAAQYDAEALAGQGRGHRVRSTRRRQDAPDLPRRTMRDTTVGRTYAAPDGRVYRPSMFITLTLPSYGRVRGGVPVDPGTYDYRRAARDALHFSKLVDRFVQNLRRVAGFSVQYFASVEGQKRGAPHLHMAIRGTLPRAELRQVIAATYHQVWWPAADEAVYEGDRLPVWSEGAGGYVDPASGEVLPTWDEALDRLGVDEDAAPLHVARFGVQHDVQGLLAGTADADQRVRYLTKYLTKSLGETVAGGEDGDAARRAHVARLVTALRYEPCSPSCSNWLRYGVQPRGAVSGLVPGWCRGKAHRAEQLGYGGRRVLVSRRWSGKSMGDHRRDRRSWVMAALGLDETPDAHRYVWRRVAWAEADVGSLALGLLREVASRQRWRAELERLRARANDPPHDSETAVSGNADVLIGG